LDLELDQGRHNPLLLIQSVFRPFKSQFLQVPEQFSPIDIRVNRALQETGVPNILRIVSNNDYGGVGRAQEIADEAFVGNLCFIWLGCKREKRNGREYEQVVSVEFSTTDV